MKQVLQSLKNGQIELADVPSPSIGSGQLLIATNLSLISAGTERMLIDFGKSSYLKKALQQPDKMKMVLEKAQTDGIISTLNTVRNKLDQPLSLGYSNVGVVKEIGNQVLGWSVGDRVVSNGKHAEVVAVPKNLCAKIPDSVSDEEASFTVLGSIALNGIRLANPTFGETVGVFGLGIIGLLTVQLLRANGCHVIALDFNPERLMLAKKFGAVPVQVCSCDPISVVNEITKGLGLDAAIITASTTSNEPIHQAALMSRKRGRIVLVGVAGLNLSRDDFFKKELTLQVAASYGPGRYDPLYEEKGCDYPIGYVRWTEQRNFDAVLSAISNGLLNVKDLISHRFLIEAAEDAYRVVSSNSPSVLGVVLNYPTVQDNFNTDTIKFLPQENPSRYSNKNSLKVSFIGAGNYANTILIPAFKKAGADLYSIASASGVTGVHLARKFGFKETTTNTEKIIQDDVSDIVVIATRHNTHAKYLIEAIKSGKSVFIEKPMCLTLEELECIRKELMNSKVRKYNPKIMVGFNRRFSPHVFKITELLKECPSPKAINMTINAGCIPADSWVHDLEIGGGRIIGEGCHFIDLLRHLVGYPIERYDVVFMDSESSDTASINLKFADGSIGTINYYSNGNRSLPKERIEIFSSGRVLVLDNYRVLRGYGWNGFKSMRLLRQDKGQYNCVRSFIDSCVNGTESPIKIDELLEVSRIAINISKTCITHENS